MYVVFWGRTIIVRTRYLSRAKKVMAWMKQTRPGSYTLSIKRETKSYVTIL